MRGFFTLILAVAVSALVIPLAMRLAPLLGMVDEPDPRKVHSLPVPRVGGWGIVAGSLLPLLLLDSGFEILLPYMIGSIVLLLFGAWDDARQIGHWPKFFGQALAVACVVYWGKLYVTRLPFVDGEVFTPAAGQAFTMFAMIGVINAINHSDGLDGLAGGETLLSFIAIAFLGYVAQSSLVTDIALAAIGGTMGFLRYNTHPARVFMGDSGSQFLGFTVAFLVIYLVQVANPAASAALPLLLFGLPIADILMVLYKRAAGGMSWFKATRNHVHHRLLDLGFTHYQSVVSIYSLQAALVVAAVLLRYAQDGLIVAIYLSAIVALFMALSNAERNGWRLSRGGVAMVHVTSGWLLRLRDASSQRTVLWGIAITVPALCLFAALWAREIPQDFGVIAGLVAVALALTSRSRLHAQSMALRMGAYIAVAFAAWLFVHYPRAGGGGLPTGAATVVILALALALAVFVSVMSDRRFGTTPTDYLIVFTLLALMLFWRAAGGEAASDILLFVTYAIVLFYGCEVIISHLERWRFVLGGSSFAVLLIVALRGLISLI